MKSKKISVKTIIVLAVLLVLIALWAVRIYSLNGRLGTYSRYPITVLDVGENITFGENDETYNVFSSPGYSVTVESARVIETDAYIAEFGKDKDDFRKIDLPEKYVEVTLSVSNYSVDSKHPYLYFHGFPLLGTDWSLTFDSVITAFINDPEYMRYEVNTNGALAASLEKGTTETVRIAYGIPNTLLGTKDRFDNLEEEKMWLMVIMRPVCKRVEITFDE